MQDMLTMRDFSYNPVISFRGIVLGILREYDEEDDNEPCVLICSASRRGRTYTPLLLQLDITDSNANKLKRLQCGEIVSGEVAYQNHILGIIRSSEVLTFKKGLLSSELQPVMFPNSSSCLFQTKKLLAEAFGDYESFLHFIPFEFLPVADYYTNFRILLKSGLGKLHSSLVSISFYGMTIKRIRKPRPKESCKHYLCLLYHETERMELPQLVTCGVCKQEQNAPDEQEADEKLAAGDVFMASNLPILQALAREGTAILECGEAVTWKKLNSEALSQILPVLYDGLLDFMYGRRLCWEFIFPDLRARDTLPDVMLLVRDRMDRLGIAPTQRIHGYWGRYHLYMTALGPKTTNIPKITIIMPDFATSCHDPDEIFKPIRNWQKLEAVWDNWIKYYFSSLPARIFVMPDDLAPELFPVEGCSVSIAEEPRILEGPFRPDENTWNLVCQWIRHNVEVLKTGYLWVKTRYGRKRFRL